MKHAQKYVPRCLRTTSLYSYERYAPDTSSKNKKMNATRVRCNPSNIVYSKAMAQCGGPRISHLLSLPLFSRNMRGEFLLTVVAFLFLFSFEISAIKEQPKTYHAYNHDDATWLLYGCRGDVDVRRWERAGRILPPRCPRKPEPEGPHFGFCVKLALPSLSIKDSILLLWKMSP